MTIPIQPCIRTLRLKVKPEGRAWLNKAAIEVNQVWNYANETSSKASSPFAGAPKWLSEFDLNNLTAGAAREFDFIGSETIQRVNAEFATRRNQFKKHKLKWRISKGSRRSLGWVPFKTAQLKLKGKCIRFSGKAFRVLEQERLSGVHWKCGCFAQDAVGDWWLCVPVEYAVGQAPAQNAAVGIDLGLKNTAATSDGAKLEAGHFYNTCANLLAARPRALLAAHPAMSDQFTRAALMERIGAAGALLPSELSPQVLAQKLRVALDAPAPAATLALDGAQRSAALLESLANRADVR